MGGITVVLEAFLTGVKVLEHPGGGTGSRHKFENLVVGGFFPVELAVMLLLLGAGAQHAMSFEGGSHKAGKGEAGLEVAKLLLELFLGDAFLLQLLEVVGCENVHIM